MGMPITPQGDYYGLPEHRRAQRDLPPSALVADALRGPSITPGLLHTRRTARGAWSADGSEYVTDRDLAEIPDNRQDFIDWAVSQRRPTDEAAIEDWVSGEFSNYPQGPGTGYGEPDEYNGDAHDEVLHQLLDDPDLDPALLPEPPDEDYHRFAQRRSVPLQ